jgi:3-deoxy-7-phosphoheptulonate synthase
MLERKINFFQDLKLIMSGNNKQTTLIGRIAGQYAKPRSNEFMIHKGEQIHNYKGDNVNSLHHDDRVPSADKLR